MKQYEAVIQTLESLGGVATLGQLNQEVFKITECEWKTKTRFASIRRIVQTNKEIYKVQRGLYALVKCKKRLEQNGIVQLTKKNADSEEVRQFTHGHYQGMLLTIGNLRGMETYAPNQDRNRPFGSQKIGEVRTKDRLPEFGYGELVRRASTIDAVWLNARHMPDSFFEVEHSTDIQNSLLKFADLQDFNARMFIVADASRRRSFMETLGYAAFGCFSESRCCKVRFLSYDELEKQYAQAIAASQFQTKI